MTIKEKSRVVVRKSRKAAAKKKKDEKEGSEDTGEMETHIKEKQDIRRE